MVEKCSETDEFWNVDRLNLFLFSIFKEEGIKMVKKKSPDKGMVYKIGSKKMSTLDKKDQAIVKALDIGHGVLYVGEGSEPWQVVVDEQSIDYEEMIRGVELGDDFEPSGYDPWQEAKKVQQQVYEEELDDWQKEKEAYETEKASDPKEKARTSRFIQMPQPTNPKKSVPIEKIYQKFRVVFNDRSWNNETACRLLFHVIIGVLLKSTRYVKGANYIDPRVSIIWVQSSGSGKTSARMLVKEVSRDLGIHYEEVSEFTDAALIGTFIVQTVSGKAVPIPVYGFLKDAELVYMDDANDFIAQENIKQHSLNTRKHIRDALNPIGNNQVVKHLRHGTIKFEPDCAVVATTYYFPGWIASQDNSGFFQRFVVFPRALEEEDRLDNMTQEEERIKASAKQLAYLEKQRRKAYQDLIKSLMKVDRQPRIFVIDYVATKYIFEISRGTGDYIRHLGRVKQFTTEFLDRTRHYIFVLSLHSAAIAGRTVISKADAEYAVRIVVPIFKEMIMWVEGASKEKQTAEEVTGKFVSKLFVEVYKELEMAQGKSEILKSDLIDAVSKHRKGRKSTNTIRYKWLPFAEYLFHESKVQKGRKRYVYWTLKKA